jgi:hypothetical protein
MDRADVLQYNIFRPTWSGRHAMTHPHHHHPEGHAHPSAAIALSLIRLSAVERLGAAAVVIALLWGAVVWAMW